MPVLKARPERRVSEAAVPKAMRGPLDPPADRNDPPRRPLENGRGRMRLTFVMIADIPPGAELAFQRYESLVLPALARHGGRLERRLRTNDALTEVHVVSFESQAAYDAYLADEERRSHRALFDGRDDPQDVRTASRRSAA